MGACTSKEPKKCNMLPQKKENSRCYDLNIKPFTLTNVELYFHKFLDTFEVDGIKYTYYATIVWNENLPYEDLIKNVERDITLYSDDVNLRPLVVHKYDKCLINAVLISDETMKSLNIKEEDSYLDCEVELHIPLLNVSSHIKLCSFLIMLIHSAKLGNKITDYIDDW
jgi:hypothetical protein